MSGVIILQRPIVNPCRWCHREVEDPETQVPSPLYGTPDKDWLVVQVTKLSSDIDKEISFGNMPGALITLCVSCRDALFKTLDPDTILDYRDGGPVPKIISGREPPQG